MQDDRATVLSLEQALRHAEIARDFVMLDRLLADDLIYVHSSGRVESKQALFESRKKVKFVSMERRDLRVRMEGGIAVLTGYMVFEAHLVGSRSVGTSTVFVTQILTRRDGEWRLSVHHATALADVQTFNR